MNPFSAGDRVSIATTTEVLLVLACDGEDVWCRDDVGNKLTLKAEDLVLGRRGVMQPKRHMVAA